MKGIRGLFQRERMTGAEHHTVIHCECGLWYQLTWKTYSGSLLLQKAEFLVRCAGCGTEIASRGYEKKT